MFTLDYAGNGKYAVYKNGVEYLIGENPKHLITSLILDPDFAQDDISVEMSEAVQIMIENDPDEHFSFLT